MSSPAAVAGVDVGGTKILGIAYDVSGAPTPLAEHRVATPTGAPAIVDAVVEVVESLRVALEADGGALRAIGLGMPGLVDRRGTLRFAPNLPGVAELPMGEQLSARVSLPCVVENDATCATWAEHELGAAQVDDAVLVTLGTGIGAGIVAGGRLQRGANGFAGEVGHLMVDPHGPPCPCGRRGCWERYASGSGLGRMGRDAAHAHRGRLVELAGGDSAAVRGEHVAQAAREGDAQALAVIDEFCHWVAVGLANLVNLLDPAVIVIGGGLVAMADLCLERIREAYPTIIYAPDHRPPPRIEVAQVGEDAGALGAALLARDEA
jgi:glucokinase